MVDRSGSKELLHTQSPVFCLSVPAVAFVITSGVAGTDVLDGPRWSRKKERNHSRSRPALAPRHFGAVTAVADVSDWFANGPLAVYGGLDCCARFYYTTKSVALTSNRRIHPMSNLLPNSPRPTRRLLLTKARSNPSND